MQFYLNGFKPGDPALAEQSRRPAEPQGRTDQVDVLIVGCGPAGLTLAAQMAAFPDISTCIVEQRPGPLELGQADGIACRTMEMFEAFGFSERVLKEAYWVNETTFWRPDDHDRRIIVRGGRVKDTEEGLSEFPHVILNQARVHQFLLDVMGASQLEPCYSRRLAELRVDAIACPSHPVTATFECLDPDGGAGSLEIVRARFVVGCDGARSTVRQAIGQSLHGDSANQAWGVMDVLAVTDFPDARFKSAIHSANEGNLLIIPREGGYLCRIYIELDKLADNERVTSRRIGCDHLIAAAQRVLRPYTLEVKEVAWWSVYEIGQRLCDRFDDVPAGQMPDGPPRVFIAGDACHTHSPKAGQGMNVSMGDAFNLGWKLASVLRGQSSPSLLHTYSAERQAIAKGLIDFDREWARMFSAPPKDPGDPDSEGVDPAQFQEHFVLQGRFTAGTAVQYAPSAIIGKPDHQHLAQGLVIGERFHSAPVIRVADARPLHLGHVVKADGRWRLFAFASSEDPCAPDSRLGRLCEFLTTSETSPVRKYTPPDADIDAVIDVRAIVQNSPRNPDLGLLPPLLSPPKGRYGLRDQEKVFGPDHQAGQDIFDLRGIDRQAGCLVVIRPDQYVAHVLPLDAYAELSAFFDGFMQAPDLGSRPA